MTGTVRTDDQPKRRNGADRAATLVSGNKLAVHFGVTRQHVEQLTAQGVIERRADGKFDQDQSRLRYLAHLRDPARRSARSEAAAEHAKAKTEMLQIRIMERQRKLVRREDVDALVDHMAGIVLTHLSGMSARCSRDLVVRRSIDATVTQIRREISEACSTQADAWNEPPLDQQD